MENEKRKVGDYTVLCAVNIGSREIIFAENAQSANGERFLCCYGERNDIFERFTECAVGDDYIDATLFFAERIKQDAERFRAEVEKMDIPVTVITEADCIPDHYKNDINGKIIAINPAILILMSIMLRNTLLTVWKAALTVSHTKQRTSLISRGARGWKKPSDMIIWRSAAVEPCGRMCLRSMQSRRIPTRTIRRRLPRWTRARSRSSRTSFGR